MDFPLPCLIARGYYPTFHSYSIHIPFIFHWYSIHITIKSPFLDDFPMISHVVPIWTRSSLQTWAQVRGPAGFNRFKHQWPDIFFPILFMVKFWSKFMDSWNLHGILIFMNYSWNLNLHEIWHLNQPSILPDLFRVGFVLALFLTKRRVALAASRWGKKWLIDLTGALVSSGRTSFAPSRTEVRGGWLEKPWDVWDP